MYTHSHAIGDDDGETTRHHRGREPLLQVELQVESLREMDALAEHPRWCALLTDPLRPGGVSHPRPPTLARPRVVGLKVGARDGDRITLPIGAAVHDPRPLGH